MKINDRTKLKIIFLFFVLGLVAALAAVITLIELDIRNEIECIKKNPRHICSDKIEIEEGVFIYKPRAPFNR